MLVGFVIFAIPLLLRRGRRFGRDRVSVAKRLGIRDVFHVRGSVLIPFQAGFEEVFFRGYLMQGFALLTRNRGVLVVVTAASIHAAASTESRNLGNMASVPYVARIFTLGGFFALLTLLDGGIELAVGIHVINNLIYTLLAATSVSAIQSPALFLIEVDEYEVVPGHHRMAVGDVGDNGLPS